MITGTFNQFDFWCRIFCSGFIGRGFLRHCFGFREQLLRGLRTHVVRTGESMAGVDPEEEKKRDLGEHIVLSCEQCLWQSITIIRSVVASPKPSDLRFGCRQTSQSIAFSHLPRKRGKDSFNRLESNHARVSKGSFFIQGVGAFVQFWLAKGVCYNMVRRLPSFYWC